MTSSRRRSAFSRAVLTVAALALPAFAAGKRPAPATSASASASAAASASASSSASAPSTGSAPPPAYPLTTPPPSGPKPLAITVSGGVSLGAYEAGFLYYVVETLRANPKEMRLELLTGASAGSINSLLSLLESCSTTTPAPAGSLLFRAWADTGFDELFVPEDVRPTGLFSRRGLTPVIDKMRETFASGLPETCDAVLGVTTTRTSPDPRIQALMPLPLSKAEERFTLHVRGKGQGKPLFLENFVTRRLDLIEPMLPLDPSGSIGFEDVRDLLLASSAFPLAFPAQGLRHCYSALALRDHQTCSGEEARRDLYVDGGVFDNQPLRLAARLAASGLARDGDAYKWRDVPDFEKTALPEGIRFLQVSPDLTAYPEDDAASESHEARGVLDVISSFASTFVDTARTKELAALFDERPDIRDRVTVSHVNLPTTSGLLHAFFGFFERDFRVFDFYLGMHDARRLFKDELAARMLGVEDAKLLVYPDPVKKGVEISSMSDDWQRFACIRGVLEGNDDLAAACEGDSKQNFRALLQTSFDRLYSTCASLASKLVPTTSRHCMWAMEARNPPRVPGLDAKATADWRREPGETDLEHTLRRLTTYGFEFHDLGVKTGEQGAALLAIRRKLGRALGKLADVQPDGGKALLRLLAVPALNLLAYAPPDRIAYGVVGSPIELGYSGAIGDSVVRFNPALQLRGVGSLLASGDHYVSLAPVVGLEVPIPYANGNMIQTRFGLRVGYIFSSSGGFPFKSCGQASSTDVGPCSRLTTQAVGELTLYDRIRLHVLFDVLPKLSSDQRTLWEITPSLGAQMIWDR